MRSRTTFLLPKLPHISFHLILDLKLIFLKFLLHISIHYIERHFLLTVFLVLQNFFPRFKTMSTLNKDEMNLRKKS
jgi:hypothetical protein